MALEIGGRADKFGNEYERLWLIRQALRMLEGEAASIYWEPLGIEGEGIEFRLSLLDGTTEAHQCKRENGIASKWTAASLKKVLPKAKGQLLDNRVDRYVFVSRDPVPIVRDLAERSHTCNGDGAAFRDRSVTSKHRKEFECVCEMWRIDTAIPEQLADMLRVFQGLRFKVWDDGRESVERAASRLARGQSKAIVACIGDFLFRSIGNEVHVDQLRQHLREAGHPPWDFRSDEIAPAIERLQREFEDSVGSGLIGGAMIPRPETAHLQTLLVDPDGPRTILLHGASGAGKSGVLLELMRELGKEGTVVLPVRLDIHRPDTTLEAFGDELCLPAPLSDCLAAVASGRPAVLILDQLDAIRWTGGHSAKAWAICKEIIDRAHDSLNVRVVIACRTFDLEDDQQLKAWETKARESPFHRLERVEAKKLSDDVVKRVVGSYGRVYERMSVRERTLLANPQCLYVWCAIKRWDQDRQTYDTQTDLLSEFLGGVRRQVIDAMGVQTTDYDALVDSLVDYLDRNSRLDAPRGHVAQYQKALDGIRSVGIVQQVGSRLRFTHQSYFDHLVAVRVLKAASRDEHAPAEWLRSGGQSLLQRQQLRQLLLLLRDREPQRYARTLRTLLADSEVRFHLKHLALNHLRAITEPNEQERSLVLEWLSTDEWRTYVLEESIARNAAWFDAVDDERLVTSWLNSGDAQLIEKAQWLCRIFAEERPERVEAHLRAAWITGDEQARRFVDWAMPYSVHKQTEAMFGWRLERIRTGAYRLEFHQVEMVAKMDGVRAIRMLEAFIHRELAPSEATGPTSRRRIDLEGERFDPLELACREHSATAWSLLLPLLDKTLKLRAQLEQQIENGDTEEDQYHRRDELLPILSLLERTLIPAGASIASTDPSGAIARVRALEHPKESVVRRVIAGMLAEGDPVSIGDFAIEWLCSDTENLELRHWHERPIDDPSRLLVLRLSPHCSDRVFKQLEATILAYHTDWERKTVKRQLSRNEINEYGKPQSILLSALPAERQSAEVCVRRTMFERKFGPVEKYPPEVSSGGGFVGSPIDNKADMISDAQWLQIVSKRGGAETWRQAGPDRLEEASPRTFSRVLQGTAHKEPERFAKLALRMPKDAPPAYFSALLWGISETRAPKDISGWQAASVEDIERVIGQISPITDVEVARAVCWAVRGRPNEGWCAETRSTIRDFVRTVVEPIRVMSASGTESAQEDLDFTSLHCLQGAVAEAIAALTYANQDLVPEFLPTVRGMVRDPISAVRLAALVAVGPVYNHNRDEAAALFVEACSHDDDRLLASRVTWDLLRYLREPYANEIAPILERMASSRLPATANAGAFWVTIQKHTLDRERDLAGRCASGTAAQRKGVVEALNSLCESEEWRANTYGALSAFFSDDDDEVLSSAVDVFRNNRVLGDTAVGPALAIAFTESAGFQKRLSGMINWLERWEGSLVPYAEAILRMIARLSGELAENTRDVSRRNGMVGQDTATVLLRLYGEACDGGPRGLRDRCLDALDALLKGRVGFVKERLDKLDAE